MNWHEREAQKKRALRERQVGILVAALTVIVFWSLFFYAFWGGE